MTPPLRLRGGAGFWWGVFLAWIALLFVLSSIPSTPGARASIPHLDKAAHFVYFAAGAFAFGLARARGRLGSPGSLVLTLAVFGTIGVLDEFHQSFTAGRDGNDPGDLAADLAGAAAGWWAAARLVRPRPPEPATRRD